MSALAWVAVVLSGLAVAGFLPPPVAMGHGTGRSPRATPRAPSGTADLARLRWLLALAAGAGVLALLSGPLGWVGCPIATALVWRAAGRLSTAAARRRAQSIRRDLPAAVDLLVACLRGGAAPSGAVAVVAQTIDGPVAQELTLVSRRLDLGAAPPDVWRSLAEHPELGPLGRCLSRATATGASVTHAMDRLAEDLRGQMRADAEEQARQVGVRAALPMGLCLLPAFVLVGIVPLVAATAGSVLGAW